MYFLDMKKLVNTLKYTQICRYVYRTGYLQFRIIPGIHWGDQVWDTMLYERPLASLKLCPEFLNFVQKIIGILLPKLFLPTVRKKCSSDRENLLEFEAEGQEFAKFLQSLE